MPAEWLGLQLRCCEGLWVILEVALLCSLLFYSLWAWGGLQGHEGLWGHEGLLGHE